MGGTAGEYEHNLVIQMLCKAFGVPNSHFHLTSLVKKMSNTSSYSSKPAQICIDNLYVKPNIVFIRNASQQRLASIKDFLGKYTIIQKVKENDWAEKSYYNSLQKEKVKKYLKKALKKKIPEDKLFKKSSKLSITICVLHDGPGKNGYQSLINRIYSWSPYVVNCIYTENLKNINNYIDGIVIIGENIIPSLNTNFLKSIRVPILKIHFKESSLARNIKHRPDWKGDSKYPKGAIKQFISKVIYLRRRVCSKIITIDGPSQTGKSTLTKALAKKLNYLSIDTGYIMSVFVHSKLTYPNQKISHSLDSKSEKILFFINEKEIFLKRKQINKYKLYLSILFKESHLGIAADQFIWELISTYFIHGIVINGRSMGTIFYDAALNIYLSKNRRFKHIENFRDMLDNDRLKDIKTNTNTSLLFNSRALPLNVMVKKISQRLKLNDAGNN